MSSHVQSVSVDLLAVFRHDMQASPRRYCPETIDSRVAVVRRYLAAVPDWETATPFQVEDFVGSQGWGPSTLRDAVSHIRQFYRWAIRHQLTDRDPTATVELPRAPRRLPRPARDAAISAAISAADPTMTAILALMCGAGLRCCEVAALRWSDVDMIAGTVHVTGKFDRERVLEISPDVRRTLAAIDSPGSHIFVSPANGRPYTATRISQLVGAHLRSVGAGCSAHQLRHRFATAALAECADITKVRDLLGHSSVATTEIYAQVTPGVVGTVSKSITVPGL